jgi:hypothetical protein
MTADLHGSYLFPSGDLLLALNYIGAVRLDACGDVVWTLAEGIHHSIARAEDGSFWMSGVSKKRRTTTAQHPEGFPGLDTSVWMDRLLHVSADGEVLDDINVLDVLYANGLERYIRMAYARGAYTSDNGAPTHLNDVEPLSPSMAGEYPLFEAGDLLVSLKHPNLVLVLDPDSETVKWHADSTPIRRPSPSSASRSRLHGRGLDRGLQQQRGLYRPGLHARGKSDPGVPAAHRLGACALPNPGFRLDLH